MKQLVLIGAAALALGFAACTEDRSAPRDDMTISSEVRKELNDERIAGNIEVRADSGTVTLTGTVPTLKDKDRAADAAKDISGVKMVVNNLRTTMAGDAPEYQQPRNPGAPVIPPAEIPPARAPEM